MSSTHHYVIAVVALSIFVALAIPLGFEIRTLKKQGRQLSISGLLLVSLMLLSLAAAIFEYLQGRNGIWLEALR